jgi:hypothetical protein
MLLTASPVLQPAFAVEALLYLVAALVTMAVYSIPHSTAGSEYDYNTGTVVTGNREAL